MYLSCLPHILINETRYSFLFSDLKGYSYDDFSSWCHFEWPQTNPPPSEYLIILVNAIGFMIILWICRVWKIHLIIKGTVLRDRFWKCWRKLTNLGLLIRAAAGFFNNIWLITCLKSILWDSPFKVLRWSNRYLKRYSYWPTIWAKGESRVDTKP